MKKRTGCPIGDSAMSELKSFRDVIELWETRELLAGDVGGASASQVSKWWQRDNIPSEWWMRVLSTEKAHGAGITSDLLARLAAREKEEAGA